MGSYGLGKKKGIGFRGPKGSNWGPRSNHKKKRLCFFKKSRNSANLSTPKKSIYIGYDPEKKFEH